MATIVRMPSGTVNPIHGVRPVSGRRVYFSLIMRTLLFALFGFLITGMLAVMGSETPFKDALKWWPLQAILANIATFFILKSFLNKEGITYKGLFDFRREKLKKDFGLIIPYILFGFLMGMIGLSGFSYLILGSFIPPEVMFEPVAHWMAILALVVFPVSNALVETPTYMGYALPRLEALTGKAWVGIVLAGLFLALQHIALPLIFDGPYLIWRFVSFIPLAVALGFLFARSKRLFPVAAAHFVMDFQMGITLFMNSIS